MKFIKEFKKVSKQNEIACATRFLCLRRPDIFVNFNNINAESLSKELRIKKNKVTYETYWDFIVEPLLNAKWSKKPKRLSKIDETIYNKRVALIT